MQAQLARLISYFERLSLRERILVSISMLVVIVIIWLQMLGDPAWQATKQSRQQLQSLQTTLASLRQQQQILQQKQTQDPLRELRERLALLERQNSERDQQLQEKLHALIEPRQMAEVLQAVLRQHQHLKLLKLQSLPAVAIRAERGQDGEDNAQTAAALYRHGLQIEFEGSYLATLDYLKALQGLPWAFYWDEVSLDVVAYPVSRVRITVHTLSLREGWIGV